MPDILSKNMGNKMQNGKCHLHDQIQKLKLRYSDSGGKENDDSKHAFLAYAAWKNKKPNIKIDI